MGHIKNIPWDWINSHNDVSQVPPFVTESEFGSWGWTIVNYVPKRSQRRMMGLSHKPAQTLFHLDSTLSRIQAKLNAKRHWKSCVLLFSVAVILFTPIKHVSFSSHYSVTKSQWDTFTFNRRLSIVNLFLRSSNSHHLKTLQLLWAYYYLLGKNL